MVRAPEPDKIPINSPSDLHAEVETLVQALQLNETEDTWEKINRAVKRFQATVRGGACRFTDDFIAAMRDPRVVKGIVRSLVTERTALSGTTLELVASCTRLGHHFSALLSPYLPTLLRLFARPNKVYVTRAASTIASIIRNTRLAEVVRFIVLEWRNEPGKSATFREQAAAALVIALGADGDALGVEKETLDRRVEDLEWLIKTGATGREPSVRSDMKKCWEVYKREWPERVASFTAPMTPTIRKYLKVSDAVAGASSAAASRPPPRKPAALSASTGPSSHPPPRPAATLSKSHAPSSTAHAPPKAAVSHSVNAAPRAHTLAASTSDSLGLGAPSLRATRVEPTRTASGSTGPSSRSASRCDERDALAASTSSARSAPAPAPARSGFKPTAPASAAGASKTGPLGSAARPAARALPTASTSAEPRKARRVAPPPAPIAVSSAPAEPTPAPPARAPALSRSASAIAVQPSSTGASAPPVPAPATAHAPFRPKLNASVATSASATAPGSKPPRPAARAPLAPAPPPVAAAPRPPRTAAAATAGTASSRAAAAGARSAPSAATLASRERRAAREAARAKEKPVERQPRVVEEKEEEERLRVKAEEASRVAVARGEQEAREREKQRARGVPLPAATPDEEGDMDVEEEAGMDSEMVLESQPASQGTVIEREEPVHEPEWAGAAVETVEEPVVPAIEQVTAVDEPSPPVDEPAVQIDEPTPPTDELVAYDEPVAHDERPANLACDAADAAAGEQTSVLAEQAVAAQVDDREAPLKDAESEQDAEPEQGDVTVQHEERSPLAHVEDVVKAAGAEPEPIPAEVAIPVEAEHVEASDGDQSTDRAPMSPVRAPSPSYDDFPPSPLLVRADAVESIDEDVQGEMGEHLESADDVELAQLECVESPAPHRETGAVSVAASPARLRSPSPAIEPANEPVDDLAESHSPAPATPTFASYTPPASSPAPVTRPTPPFTPATATPARPAVRFPVSTLQYSPEPFQTASIVLDTPPRLDELPGAVRLPARVALSVAAGPSALRTSTEASMSDDDVAQEEEDSEDEGEEGVMPASPLARKIASPAPASTAAQPQAIFLDDYHPTAPWDDVDTTFEADESGDAGADNADDSFGQPELAVEQSVADTEVLSAEQSREYAIPLNDTSAYDHLVRPEEEEGYDDSSAGEDEGSAETTRIARSPVREAAVQPEQEEAAPVSDDSLEADAAGLPVSPTGSATQDFSFFGAPVSSTPSARGQARAPWDVSLLDDESACFELEQPQLRFHDETESEHEASVASTVLADLSVAIEPRRVATPPAEVEQPTILKRSLRNRVVTVEVQTPAANKPLTRSTRSAARGVLGELQH